MSMKTVSTKYSTVSKVIIGTLLSLSINSSFAAPSYDLRVTRVEGRDSLSLRSQPTTSSAVKTYIPFNSIRIKYLNQESGIWRYVQYNGVKGWASSLYLAPYGAGEGHYYATHGYRSPVHLKVRSRPTVRSRIKTQIPEFETGVEGRGACTKSWCPVTYNGVKGWVSRSYIGSWSP